MALTAALSLAPAAHAEQYGIDKGKAAASACSLVYDVSDGTTLTLKGKKRIIGCADGSACDTDGAKNGSCTFAVDVCAAQVEEGCTAEPTTKLKATAKAKKLIGLVLPAVGVTTPTCGTPGSITIPLKGKNQDKASPLGKGKLVLKTKITSGGGSNVLFLQCNPCSGDSCGGPAVIVCPDREASGLPKQLNLVVPPAGSDLDNGFSGNSHNFTVTSQSTLKYCLSECDATTDSLCTLSGSTGTKTGSLNGPTFGAPLPLLTNNVPVCVVNRYQDTSIGGTFDLATGELNGQVNLLSDVHVQTPLSDVCPRCNGAGIGQSGVCTSGQNNGKACVVDGTSNVTGGPNPSYTLSSDCPPDSNKKAATLVISLPLTTETSTSAQQSKPCPQQTVDDACGGGTCTFDCSATVPTKGGINQTCCSNSPSTPCFPTATDSPPGMIIRNGIRAIAQPLWPDPTYPKTAEGSKAAAVFCEAATGDQSVDILSGLPGPGAIILPFTQTIVAQE
jgi:hypothetical protein